MFDVFKNRLELQGVLTTVTALRISQGRSTEPIGSDLPVVKDAFDRPLIPGSSFKGAMRSRLESFLRAIDDKLAANPAIEEEWSITPDQMTSLKQQFSNDVALTDAILAATDLVSHLFGSPWLSSKLQIQDLTVLQNNWFGQYQERDGVAIDRDTETASEGKLYDFQVVPAGTPFQFRAIVENAEEWELGLLMIGLHQFETEQIPLGGGRSRGLGVVRLENLDMTWFDARIPGNSNQTDPKKVIKYLKQITGLQVEETVSVDVAQKQRNAWTQRLISYLEQNTTLQKQQDTTTPSSNED